MVVVGIVVGLAIAAAADGGSCRPQIVAAAVGLGAAGIA